MLASDSRGSFRVPPRSGDRAEETYASVPGVPDLVGGSIESPRSQDIQSGIPYGTKGVPDVTHSSKAKAPAKMVVRKTAFLRMRDLNATKAYG